MAKVIILNGNFHVEEATRNFRRNSYSLSYSTNVSLCRSLGPYQLACHLRNNDITCQVIDYIQFMDYDQLKNLVYKFLPKNTDEKCILGVSITFIKLTADGLLPAVILDILKYFKSIYKNLTTIVGGANTTHLQQKINNIDFTIDSYAEDAALELISNLLGSNKLPLYYKLNTIIYKENSNFDIVNSRHTFSDEDCILNGETLPLEISRGCIFKCSFCSYRYTGKKKNDYIKDIDNIRAELIYNYENFKTTNYYILDDTFNETPKKVSDFYEMTKTLPFKIKYFAYIRAELLDRFPETISMLKDSGLTACMFGIETLGKESSKSIGKAWSGTKGRDFLRKLKEELWKDEVYITTSLIIGLPPDTQKDYFEFQKYLCNINIDCLNWHVYSYNGKNRIKSDIEKNPESFGFTLPDSGNWHNGLYDRNYANKIFDQLNNTAKSIRPQGNGINGYILMECFSYYSNEQISNIKTLPRSSFLNDLKIKRFNNFKKYLSLLNSLPDSY